MTRTDAETLTLAEINLDGEALCEAATLSDWDEVRFRCHLVAANAADAQLMDVAVAASELIDLLGRVGSEPLPGYGAAMNRLEERLRSAPIN